MKKTLEAVETLLTRGVVEVIDREHLKTRLMSGKPLRVKFGIDPTGPDIHIGRGSTIKKLREFQDLGHTVVLIIGDATAQIGDASDKTAARPLLSPKEIAQNEKCYLDQIGQLLDLKKTEVRHNSEWIGALNLEMWIKLASLFTIQQMVQRDNFADRLKKNNPVGYHEGLYALLQGWDSVAVKADVEIGGTDQLFNLNAGRKIQQHFGQHPQDIMTLQLLAGTDGRKMSTSWGNVILITEDPKEKFGKIMRIADQLIPVYLECATLLPMERVREVERLLSDGQSNPMDLKKELAFEVIKLYDGVAAAKKAREHFEKTVQGDELPELIPTLEVLGASLSVRDLLACLVRANLVKSKSEARRLLIEGAISVDEKTLPDDLAATISLEKNGIVVQAGKRRFLRIVLEK